MKCTEKDLNTRWKYFQQNLKKIAKMRKKCIVNLKPFQVAKSKYVTWNIWQNAIRCISNQMCRESFPPYINLTKMTKHKNCHNEKYDQKYSQKWQWSDSFWDLAVLRFFEKIHKKNSLGMPLPSMYAKLEVSLFFVSTRNRTKKHTNRKHNMSKRQKITATSSYGGGLNTKFHKEILQPLNWKHTAKNIWQVSINVSINKCV